MVPGACNAELERQGFRVKKGDVGCMQGWSQKVDKGVCGGVRYKQRKQ